ncbi:MAG: hypothetical protein U9O98_09630 [Asgard group archaeon]|nr:hypothetical protein [Asgard group archaeon]
MKIEKIFNIASIIAFFALLPALIILEVKVARNIPNITYFLIIIDILLVGFMAFEIYLFVKKWQKEQNKQEGKIEEEPTQEVKKEWGQNNNKIEKIEK